MKKFTLFFSFILLATMIVQAFGLGKSRSYSSLKPEIAYTIDHSPTIPQAERIGINLGQWTSQGTAQFGNNILQNPGLEGQINRLLVIVSQADENSFSDEAGWGYSNSEWNEAEFHIRTGKSAGKKGSIKQSLNSGTNGFPQYFSHSPLPPLEPNDIIVLTKVRRPDPVNFWQTRFEQTSKIDTGSARPQSNGTQSVKLTPSKTSKAEVSYILDSSAGRTKKPLNVTGKWRFRIWAKGENPNGELIVVFERLKSTHVFFKRTLELTTDWQEFVIDFTSDNQGPPSTLKLSIIAFNPSNSVWIDDLYLGKLNQEDVPFRKEVISALKDLSPSFIREFPSLGDTWENRIAPPHERKTWLKRLTGGGSEAIYSYSLPEFLFLCQEVGSNPWIILSPTLSNDECQKMGSFLEKHASSFSEIILEFGHENWNWLYRPTTIPYPAQQGNLADHLFDLISKAAGKKVNLIKFVNGQYTVPWESMQFLDMTTNADGLAIAPYILPSLDKATPDKQILKALFQQDFSSLYETSSEVYARDKRLALYEVNFNTTQGNARGYERNRVVSSAVAGVALSKYFLQFLMTGASPIMVYNLAQYDTPTWEVEDFVNLWGIVEDLGPPVRFRPTGLAVKMLNHVIQGGMYQLKPVGGSTAIDQQLTLAAFRGNDSWSIAIVSESEHTRTINIHFPEDGKDLPKTWQHLHFHSPFDNNEGSENVTIQTLPIETDHHSITVTIPAYSLVIGN